MDRYDVIVVGSGVMGCATAYHLAKRGRRVLLLEQFSIGHERGSSHGHSRIFRLVYDVPDYVQLARAAYPLWRELESEAGAELLLQTGGFDFADPATQSIEDTRATLVASGIPFESLDHTAITRRFPQFAVSERVVGIYQADTGILNATKCVLALAGQARRHGAIVQEQESARQIQPAGAGVQVSATRRVYAADRLVVTAGSWARSGGFVWGSLECDGLVEVARSAKYVGADAVSLGSPDEEMTLQMIRNVKGALPDLPVILAGYTNHANAARLLAEADSAFVGSCLERDGWGGSIDIERVRDYMAIVGSLR